MSMSVAHQFLYFNMEQGRIYSVRQTQPGFAEHLIKKLLPREISAENFAMVQLTFEFYLNLSNCTHRRCVHKSKFIWMLLSNKVTESGFSRARLRLASPVVAATAFVGQRWTKLFMVRVESATPYE
jgi:hypothetical protein